MLSRFLQLFLLCSLILLIPSLIYLSNSSSSSILDSGHLYAPGSLLQNGKPAGNESPQLIQGNGQESNNHPSNLNTNSDHVPNDWKWPDSIMNPIHKAEDYWKSLKKVDDKKVMDMKDDWNDEKKLAQDRLIEAASKDQTSTLIPSGEKGNAIMGKMKNETAKAELGRATWKFLHTMTLQYPVNPTPSDRETLSSFMNLFSRLYPCGECASHFQALLKELPPQTSSRQAASRWLCSAHNRVNQRLNKPDFPCNKLDENYDCGCGDQDSEKNSTTTIGPQNIAIPSEIKKKLNSKPSDPNPTSSLQDLNANNWVPPPLPILSKRDPNSFIHHFTEFQKRQESCQCQALI